MGYPTELSIQKGEWLAARGLIFYTDLMPEAPPGVSNFNPEIDLFFEYGRTVLHEGAREVEAPALNGASGCSVWECIDSGGGFWAPGKSVRVVGVQSAYF